MRNRTDWGRWPAPSSPGSRTASSSWPPSPPGWGPGSIYDPSCSGPTLGAVDALLVGRGVCHDYAHLVAALLRALDVPVRVTAVYAPGLQPMDFHAVAEVLVDGSWRVVDASLLAPWASLVRIATGRDAADTAFLSTYGPITLLEAEVSAITDGELPIEDVPALVSIR